MEGPETTGGRPGGIGIETDRICVESFHFGDEIQTLMTVVPPPESGGSSFTALLELPPTQAMELLHSPESAEAPAVISGAIQVDQHQKTYLLHNFNCSSPPTFQSKSNLIDSAARLSILADGTGFGEESTETMSSVPLNAGKVKNEPDTDSNQNSSAPLISYPTVHNKNQKSVKESNKKSKSSGNESSGDAEKLPYVHVRARRGQATNSHSLAERARREKINARMKLLQQLVPGCNKISGTALVLDEIINHVQSLQHQVELLSMRLSAVDPRVDFNLHSLFAAESGSLMDSNFPGMFAPVIWPEVQLIGNRQQDQHSWQFDVYPQQPVWGREEENHNFLTTENSLLSYDSSPNSVSLHANQLKMEH